MVMQKRGAAISAQAPAPGGEVPLPFRRPGETRVGAYYTFTTSLTGFSLEVKCLRTGGCQVIS